MAKRSRLRTGVSYALAAFGLAIVVGLVLGFALDLPPRDAGRLAGRLAFYGALGAGIVGILVGGGGKTDEPPR
jgi:hypothetical protein